MIFSNAFSSATAAAAATREQTPNTDVGFLSVASVPPAKVSVDGKDTGRTTPIDKIELPVGHHQLTLVSLDGKLTRSLGFNITKTETTRLKVNFGQ